MRNILIIAARELRGLFLSPLAWSILGVVQFIHAYLFISNLKGFTQIASRLNLMDNPPGLTEVVVVPVFGGWITIVLWLVIVPLLTMRLISEERRNRSLSLLFSAPLSMTEIVLGKYLGVVAFLLVMILMLTLMPLSLLGNGSLDLGHLAAILLAAFLLSASFAATGLLMSTLTQYPAVAAIGTMGVLLLLLVMGWVGNPVTADGSPNLLATLSILTHYGNLLQGVLDSADLSYFLLLILAMIILSIRRLDADRLQG